MTNNYSCAALDGDLHIWNDKLHGDAFNAEVCYSSIKSVCINLYAEARFL